MNKPTREATQELVREFFEYNPETGEFTRIKSIAHGRRDMVGKVSGSTNRATGYVEMCVGGVKQYAHRLAWIYMHGEIPEGRYIDHINGCRSDNRIANLRLAMPRNNLHNCKVRSDNTTGVKGVSYDPSRGKWVANVGKIRLGRFDTLFEAACARKSTALCVYGEFSRE